MGILLILAQVALVVVDLLAHVINVNIWLVFLPGLLFVAMWLTGVLLGASFALDSFTHPYRKQ